MVESLRTRREPFNTTGKSVGRNARPDASGILLTMASPRPAAAASEPLVHFDQITGRAVLIAPRRQTRPHDADLVRELGEDPSAWCPFCGGNEARTPPAVLQAPAAPVTAWQARIVPNRYPFVEACPTAAGCGTAAERPAHGIHEVLVESPRHDTSVAAIEPGGWRAAWQLAQRRLAMLAERNDLAWGTVFKNSGPMAGASLEHVHSQLVAIDFIPPAISHEFAAAARRTDPFADLLAEADKARRVVTRSEGMVALVPPAPRQPCEIWILPERQEAFFHAAGPERASGIADLTRDLVGRLARVLPGADFNWWLHEAAWGDHPAAATTDRWHWHLEILPRATPLAGFELGTGCHISAVPPDEAAARLRDA